MRLGRYDVGELLGSGAYGRVYSAVLNGPAGLRKHVALKVLGAGRGVVREARLGGLLRHPNLVDVYEAGEVDGQWFCAMEHCAGGTLASRVPLPLAAVVDAGLQVCSALSYAHEALGLVHLDLKPENLFLDGHVVKVGDLGLARANGFEAGTPRAGTPGYMAPEQIRGDAVDARTDVYALGMVLAVLATGQGRRSSDTVSLGDLETPAAPPERSAGPAPELGCLAAIVDRCTEPSPADRYPSMAALAEALRALDAPGPPLAEVLGALGRVSADPLPALGADAFVGRTVTLAELATRMGEPGLTTLRGPPGIGKSRLAVAAADRRRRQVGCRVLLLGLADARDIRGWCAVAATALDIPLEAEADDAMLTRVGHALSARGEAVVLLDDVPPSDCVTTVVARWRHLAPRAHFLATARQRLQAPDEGVVDVDVLDPDDALALLTVRALDRGIDLTGRASAVALSNALEGVPLAIELAAGRLGVLGPDEVLQRLSLSLLRSGRAGLPPRQATLRGALDWSWELLTAAERSCLSALSVFRGGFVLPSVEGVVERGPADPAVLDTVHALADRSLVRRVGPDRFDLLGSIRDHAAEQRDTTDAEVRHGSTFAAGSRLWVAALYGPGSKAARRELTEEFDNVVAATRRAVARGDGATALDTLKAASETLFERGPASVTVSLADEVATMADLSEEHRLRAVLVRASGYEHAGDPEAAIRDYREVLAAGGVDATHVKAWIGLGSCTDAVGRTGEAIATLERAVGLACDLRLPKHEALARGCLGNALQHAGRVDEARASFEASLVLHRRARCLDDEAHALGRLGSLDRSAGALDAARASLTTALQIHRDQGQRRSEGVVLWQLGVVERASGRYELARELVQASLERCREIGARHFEAQCLNTLGNLWLSSDDPAAAKRYYEQALAIHVEAGNRRDESILLGNLAITALESGDLVAARDGLEVALRVARELDNRSLEGVLLYRLAGVAAHEERLDEAIALHERALVLLRSVANRRHEGAALQHLADALRQVGRTSEAEVAAQGALALHQEVGNDVALELTLRLLAKIQEALGADGPADGLTDRGSAPVPQRPPPRQGRS